MKRKPFSLNPVFENVIIGTLCGGVVGYILKLTFRYIEIATLVMVLFLVFGILLGILSGIERKRMMRLKIEKLTLEEDLTRNRVALKRTANKYQLLVENASDAIFLTTNDGRFLLFNEATSLLSGYSRKLLKNMTLDQLRADDEEQQKEKMSQAWLDNSICRYEEKWRTKSGQIITLEVSAKWFQISGNELILNVARDIMQRKETGSEMKTHEMRSYQYSKLLDMARIQNNFYQEIVDPVNDTIRVFNHLLKTYPDEQEKLSGSITKWENARIFLQSLLSKNLRDLESSPTQYDINEIINQEIQFLKRICETDKLNIEKRLTGNLPPVWGLGRDFSLAFGILLRSVYESIKLSGHSEFMVTSDLINENVIVQIQTDFGSDFKESLSRIVNPSLGETAKPADSQMDMAWTACQYFFQAIGAQFEINASEEEGKKQLIIQVQMPSVRHDQSVIRVQKSKMG